MHEAYEGHREDEVSSMKQLEGPLSLLQEDDKKALTQKVASAYFEALDQNLDDSTAEIRRVTMGMPADDDTRRKLIAEWESLPDDRWPQKIISLLEELNARAQHDTIKRILANYQIYDN